MKIVRTIVWVLLLTALLVFSAFNWKPVEVKIWEGMVLETKIPALVVIAFLVGLVPMWLLHRANRWNNERRIASLESAARAAAMAPAAPAPFREEPRGDLSPTDETQQAP
jgi:lipopolysaccharide assembly protein A